MGMGCVLSYVLGSIEDYEICEPTSDKPRRIGDWVRGIADDARRLNELPPYEKFCQFTVRLLASQSNEAAWWRKMVDMLYEFGGIGGMPRYDILYPYVKSTGYRFPPRGTSIISAAIGIYRELSDPARDFDRYLSVAVDRARDGFLDDTFLKINGVGRKTRDLALTDFTLAYPVVDIHVKRVLLRLGLVDDTMATLAYDKVTAKEYERLRNECFSLAKAMNMRPAELDRLLWHFGRAVCQKIPLCEGCPVNTICPWFKRFCEGQ